MFYDQSQFDIRCEWGIPGIHQVGRAVDVVIIVDVLSFTTCVDVAVSQAARIFPYRWEDETATEYAAKLKAVLAAPRGQIGAVSLSPSSMQNLVAGMRIVLPSPNGSELTVEAQSLGKIVLAGCFRNAWPSRSMRLRKAELWL